MQEVVCPTWGGEVLSKRRVIWLTPLARLKPGLDLAQAKAGANVLYKQILQDELAQISTRSERFKKEFPLKTLELLPGARGTSELRGQSQTTLLVLMGMVGLVLLIACANVANLLLARAAVRQKEIAIRMAMGAKRWRLLRQLMTESVLLSLVGGLLGVLLAFWGVRGLVAALPSNIPRADEIRIDSPVLLFTLGIALFTGLAFGIAPAWKMSSIDVHDPLKEGGRGTTPGHHRVRDALVVSEVALALILLVGAGLLLRSFYRVLQADAGFKAGGVLTANVALPATDYEDPKKQTAFLERVLENLRALPGVQVAGATIPLLGGWQSSFNVERRPEPPKGQRPSADIARVSPDYFRAMGVRVKEGRVFTEQDRQDTPRVCVIDETFARTYWPNESALGKRVKFGRHEDEEAPWLEVVGVVGHVKNYGVDEESRVELYMPYLQDPRGFFALLLRTGGDPASLTAGVRQAVTSVNPDVPVFAARALTGLVDERTAERRLAVLLISVFAGVALLLAAVGIYGILAYAVGQRRREIGVRMALGAQRRDLLWLVLREGLVLAVGGAVLGLLGAAAAGRSLQSVLFGVTVLDPVTYAGVLSLVLVVTLLACLYPARRAASTDPLASLRVD
jgi:putative ABC transport system permease protein